MKRTPIVLALATTLLAAAPSFAATTFVVDPGHSEVSFTIRHLMSRVRGTFDDFSGTIVRDDQDATKSSVEFRIQTKSVDTRNPSRDNDLRSDDFFDVEKFPEINFKSTAVEKVSDSLYQVTGTFSLHGVTKELTLPVNFEGEAKDPRGIVRAGFSLTTKLDRKEYGMNWNRALDNGGYLLSDEVVVDISLEAKQQP